MSCGGDEGSSPAEETSPPVEGTSSPGTVICDEIDVYDELRRMQEELTAAESAGDTDTAALLRSNMMAVGACDEELVARWQENPGAELSELLPAN